MAKIMDIDTDSLMAVVAHWALGVVDWVCHSMSPPENL